MSLAFGFALLSYTMQVKVDGLVNWLYQNGSPLGIGYHRKQANTEERSDDSNGLILNPVQLRRRRVIIKIVAVFLSIVTTMWFIRLCIAFFDYIFD